MTEFEDQREIIRTIQILDRDAVDEIADTIGSVIERFRQATQTLTAQLDQAQQSKEDADRAAGDLQQRLHIGVQLLRALEERGDEIKDIGQTLDSRKQLALEAEQRLEEKFAEFDQRLGEAVTKFEQQTQNTSDGILERTVAVSELVESAEVNVALMARRISQALEQTIAQPSEVRPSLTPPSISAVASAVDSESTQIDEQQTAESQVEATEPLSQQPSISTEEIDELITSGDVLKSELNQLSTLCEQLKTAQQAAKADKEKVGNDFVDDEKELLQAEPLIDMPVTQAPTELYAPISRLNTLLDQLKQTTLDHQQQRFIKAAEFAVSGMRDLVETVEGPLKVDARDFELDSENFDLRGCIDEVFALITLSAEKAQIKLVQCVHEDVQSLVLGDQGRLIRALVLAIGQAIKQATLGEVILNVTIDYKTDDLTNLRFAIKEQRPANAVIPTETETQSQPLSQEQNAFSDTDFSSGVFGRLIEQLHGNFGVDADESEGFSLWFCITFGKSLEVVDDRRAHARLPQEELKCNLGEVMDLSLGGMQLRCKRVPKGDYIDIELTSEDMTLDLKGEVVRSKKLGFRKYEIGVRFQDVDPETAKLITQFSLNHLFRPIMGPE
ncbi:MAG: PilZ domain-containing protein [Planctomycetes bacterium]|nr:PilZ domain-containing protein [Planctomycetota bacterium]